VLLPALVERAAEFVRRCDGIILSGDDDPIMEQWGTPNHPRAGRVDPARQAFELALLAELDRVGERPVLGICLGMQFIGLHYGGTLEQHLPDTLPTADDHWGRRSHSVTGALGSGVVHSHHHQALSAPGALAVVATVDDGVIEAIQAPDRPFYLGVQWHCERTEDDGMDAGLIRRLAAAAGR
jgi:putative glutamine amidotransferase